MTIFNTSFREEIQTELKLRTEGDTTISGFKYTQDYLGTYIRATALIQGTYTEPETGNLLGIEGFTLGIPDNNMFTDITHMMSSPRTGGCAVGITYNHERPVILSSVPENIPTPGITSVEINSLYRGGFVLDSKINFKFYTKAQYDFLYETFFRPGSLVVVEYGHVSDKKTFKPPLPFGDNDVVQAEMKRLSTEFFNGNNHTTNATNDYIVGIVVNYDIKLNENNEYEGEITLTNAGEFAYSLGTDETLIKIRTQPITLGIESSTIQVDTETQSGGTRGEAPTSDTITQTNITTTNSNSLNQFFGAVDSDNDLVATDLVLQKIKSDLQFDPLVKYIYDAKVSAFLGFSGKTVDYQISMWYFFAVLLPWLLFELIDVIPEDSELRDILRKIRNDIYSFKDTGLKYFEELRTINIDDVIINNAKLWESVMVGGKWFPNSPLTQQQFIAEFFINKRQTAYKEHFNIVDEITNMDTETSGPLNYQQFKKSKVSPLFFVDQVGRIHNDGYIKPDALEAKEYYKPDDILSTDELQVASTKGVFLSYKMIRQSFLESTTLVDALNKILSKVSVSTKGIIKLKVRYAEDETGQYRLILYDESLIDNNSVIGEVYTFNKRLNSEVSNINFDFGLSQAAAATIASGYGETMAVGGNLKDKLLVDYGIGRNSNIRNIDSDPVRDISDDNIELSYGSTTQVEPQANTSGDEDSSIPDVSPIYTGMSGVIELLPDEMYSIAVISGLLRTLPSAATVDLQLQGISGFRYGDMFKVQDILPGPYEEKGLFFLTGYKHSITPNGWTTNIQGQYLGSAV